MVAACPPKVQLLPTVTLPEIPTCATNKQFSPIISLWPRCTKLSILVPLPTMVLSTVALSRQVLQPTSTSSPITTLPVCNTLVCLPSVVTKPKPSPPITQPACKITLLPITHFSLTETLEYKPQLVPILA